MSTSAPQPDAPVADRPDAWLTPGVRGIGAASFFADVGHEIPTAPLPSLMTSTLGAPAAALGLIEGVSDGLAGVAKFVGGPIGEDPARRGSAAVGGYRATAVRSSLTGGVTAVWQVGVLRAGAWSAGAGPQRVLADLVPGAAYGRAYGFERMMDNLGAKARPGRPHDDGADRPRPRAVRRLRGYPALPTRPAAEQRASAAG